MIITVTLNPAIDRTVQIENFEIGTVNRIVSEQIDASGKGINVSKTIRNLRGKSKAIGILGGKSGIFIKDYLDRLNIENEFVFIEGETRTNLKIIDTVRKTNTEINEPGPYVTGEDLEKVENLIFKNLAQNSIAVFSGSVPKNVDSKIYSKWIKKARCKGMKTILDADGDSLKYGIAQGPYICKPNIKEFESLMGKKIESINEAKLFGEKLINDYEIEMLVVSLGERGALYINKSHSCYVNALEVELKSTVGAGDAMVAALAFSLDMGYNLEKSIKLSMASGIASVMASGSPVENIMDIEKKINLNFL